MVERVRTVIEAIPEGEVLSYGQVADRAGLRSPRLVGRILSEIDGLPWHRVVRADGSPTPHLATRQLRLLRAEGVRIVNGRAVETSEAHARAVVLVEGVSDQRALEALALRRGRNLAAEGVAIVAMGGSKNITSFLDRFGPGGANIAVAGLCDEAEEGDYRRSLERAGFGSQLTRADMESLGFYVCVADLEDELIRALGTDAVERIIESQDELGPFRTFQNQPAQRGRTMERQLRRFLGTKSGRKIRYGALLVDALDLDKIPPPLDGVLAHVKTRMGGAERT